jgi:hypothetical protein
VQASRTDRTSAGTDARLVAYAQRGIAGLRLDVEAGPEAYAPLMERLDAML